MAYINSFLNSNLAGTIHANYFPELALSHSIGQLALENKRPILIIVQDQSQQDKVYQELLFFLSGKNPCPIYLFPDRETLPYDVFSPHQDIISERLATLYKIKNLSHGIIISSCPTLLHFLLPPEHLERQSFIVQKHDRVQLDSFREDLVKAGYYSVTQVMQHGEFAIRGSIIDLFPMGSKKAIRLDLFDDEVDSIRYFDAETQRSTEEVTKIELLPAREYSLDDESIAFFREQWRTRFPGNPNQSAIYNAISKRTNISGIEYYLPLFYTKLANIFDYLPENTLIIKSAGLEQACQKFWLDVTERYHRCAIDHTRPILPPEELFLKANEFFGFINKYSHIDLREQETKEYENLAKRGEINYQKLPPIYVKNKSEFPLQLLNDFIASFSGRILFIAESPGRREALLSLLKKVGLEPVIFHNWHEFLASDTRLGISISSLQGGMVSKNPALAIISESQIFGEQIIQTRRRLKAKTQDAEGIVKDLIELNVGSPIVHVEHGIGRYQGLQVLNIEGIDAEFLTLEYANQDKIYVPVSHLHLIHRYLGPDADYVNLTRLGSEQWDKAKQKAMEKIRDVAAEILDLYAKRAAKQGHSYQFTEEDYITFSNQFPFELTFDQEKAIQDIFADMQSDKTMDRLVCGDVGFGKTEVAMRAAFMAISNNKQVAMLVPTTLLAQQHYQSFCDRFAEWPVNIELLSRFKTTKEQQQILDKLKTKTIDIVIGTHKLLQKNIEFKDLGLLIIDEEHRFGVKQKDALKALRAEVDILTLTATPIPRTLNMALSGARDLSIISTPPSKTTSR